MSNSTSEETIAEMRTKLDRLADKLTLLHIAIQSADIPDEQFHKIDKMITRVGVMIKDLEQDTYYL